MICLLHQQSHRWLEATQGEGTPAGTLQSNAPGGGNGCCYDLGDRLDTSGRPHKTETCRLKQCERLGNCNEDAVDISNKRIKNMKDVDNIDDSRNLKAS
jgi:hypothetical protein